MNYWLYAGLLALFMFVYFVFLEKRVFKKLGIEKWVYYEGEDSGMLTGKAYGLQQITFGCLLFLFSIPPFLFDFPTGISNFFNIVFMLVVWPLSFITSYTGLIILLRPNVFGEESRYHEVCEVISKDILMRKIPISYTEILFANARGLIFSSISVGIVNFTTFYLKMEFINYYISIAMIISYVVVLFYFLFIDKVNGYLKYDMRSTIGYERNAFWTHLLSYMPLFLFVIGLFLFKIGV